MKKLIFLLTVPLIAQINTGIRYVSVAPSGPCNARAQVTLVTPDGTLYTCQFGAWAKVSVPTLPGGITGSVQSKSSTGGFYGDADLIYSPGNLVLGNSSQVGSLGIGRNTDPTLPLDIESITDLSNNSGSSVNIQPIVIARPAGGNHFQNLAVTFKTDATYSWDQAINVYGTFVVRGGSAPITSAWNFAATNFNATGSTPLLSGVEFYGYDLSPDAIPNGGTANNAYYQWFDSSGVFRIKEDSTFNSVGQAIPALYNPQFTKYTPGAANYERLILGEFNSNVAEIGTYAGGNGVERNLHLLGNQLSFGVPSNVASTTFIGAGLNDGTLSGTYTGSTLTYCAIIDGTGTPNTFKWGTNGTCDNGATTVPMSSPLQNELSNGIHITFAASTGHTLADKWSVVATGASASGWSVSNVGFEITQSLEVIDLTTIGSASGKTVVCVDTLTGRLYASTSSVVCTNSGTSTLSLGGNTTFSGAFNPTFTIPSSSTWAFPSGGGNLVIGPNSSVNAHVATFNGTGGNVIQDGGVLPTVTGGTCTNQAVTAISSSAVPTCTTITSVYVNNTIALTGADINTSNQITATHLASPLPLTQGGSAANLTASNGGLVYSTASALAILSGTATANRIPLSGVNAAPAWSTATYPATTTINRVLYSNAANTIVDLPTTNNAVFVTSATGVPSLAAPTSPLTVSSSVLACGTCATTTNGGALSGTAPISINAGGVISITSPLPVANGGTNASSASITAFNNITGYMASGATGTTSTNIVFSTSPVITTPSITTINDANGNPFIASSATASAVDSITVTNAATANPARVALTASGSDANINLEIDAKGSSGGINLNVGGPGQSLILSPFTSGNLPIMRFTNNKNGTGTEYVSIGGLFSGNAASISFGNGGIIVWGSTTADGGNDISIDRDAAGILGVQSAASQGTVAANYRAIAASAHFIKGTTFTTNAGCGTNTSLTGGSTGGTFLLGANGPCTVIITMGNSATAPTGWSCYASDRSVLTALVDQSADTTTTASINIPTGGLSGDKISFACMAY